MRKYMNIFQWMMLLTMTLSCDMDFSPKSSLDSRNYWKSETDVANSVTAMYYSLSKALAYGCYNWGELRS